jgi:hypothetical protein
MKAMSALAGAGLMAVSFQTMAHGGGLDASGCHHNRKTGDYHCHRAPAMPAQPPSSKAAVGEVHSDLPQPQGSNTLREPTCHVGPRGGPYTITTSGRKNYAGC